MASQANDFDDLQGLHNELQGLSRLIYDLHTAHKSDEAAPLEKRYRHVSDTLRSKKEPLNGHIADLRRQITDLRKESKYAEAVPVAERFTQAVEAYDGFESLRVAEALIDLAELLIVVDRSADAELVLQRVLAIVLRNHPLKEREH